MSTAVIARARKSLVEAPWQLWTSQFMAILRTEVKKNLWMRRSIWIYLLAFAPAVMFGIHALTSPMGRNCSIAEDTRIFAYVFQIFYLRVGIFFCCMGLFTWLFRGEVVEKSLHYYFLSPVRRQVLVAAKFVAGLITTSLVFGTSVLVCFTFAYGHFGKAGNDFVFNGPGFGQLMSYLLVTVLACLGFGSLFLALSLVFKNPILPGIVILLWETFHAVAPALLQKLSVTFYLKQLCPVTIPPDGIMALFTVVAEPVSPWLAIPGLLCLSIAILIFACLRIRQTEISYLAD
ncbi:MAG TPA: ABC transporter permease [Candidatus Angelobacter sp.]|nr:ABC transporter permease [Candidatus Angelobacter sp.]